MSEDQHLPTTIRFRAPGKLQPGVQQALEELARAIAAAETDDVEGFELNRDLTVPFRNESLTTQPDQSFCIGFTSHGPGKTSCLVDWR